MEETYREEMMNGFCKTLNETRTVICELEKKNGKYEVESVDCAFGSCLHTKTCLLMQPIRELLEEE